MPGVRYEAGGIGLDAPLEEAYLLASALTGNNAAAVPGNIYAGDLCVLTTYNGGTPPLTGSGALQVPVVRPLLAQDVTNLYQITSGGSQPVGGILGVFTENITTNNSGQIIARPAFGLTTPSGVIFSMPAPSARFPVETTTARHRVPVILATTVNLFKARVDPAYANGADHRLDGTLAGLTLTTTNGVTQYYVNPSASANARILVIIKPDETDPNFGVASGGGVVYFQFLPAFCQSLTGNAYTSQ